MNKHKLSISFSKEYSKLYNFLKGKNDRSNFVCKILNEYLKENKDINLEQIVERAVAKALRNHNIITVNSSKLDKEDEIRQEDKDLIKNLF